MLSWCRNLTLKNGVHAYDVQCRHICLNTNYATCVEECPCVDNIHRPDCNPILTDVYLGKKFGQIFIKIFPFFDIFSKSDSSVNSAIFYNFNNITFQIALVAPSA